MRNGAGIFDLSSFGKILVDGRGAARFLQRVCANDIDVKNGKIVYTQMLNEKGCIECDLTVTRLFGDRFILVVPAATIQRDLAWLRRHVEDAEFVSIFDATASESVICVMGPHSRTLMQKVSPCDFSNEGHPFGTAKEIEIGLGIARAHRISYVGELGWEIYVSADQAAHVFEELEKVLPETGAVLCGLHALDSCRIEKAFRHFGHDISDEDHVIEAGLGFSVKTEKGNFVGRDAVLEKLEKSKERMLLQFMLHDPEPLLFHNEPIIRDGEVVSYLTSGNYGHFLGAAIGMGYVPCKGESANDVLSSSFEIDVAGKLFSAKASLRPLYDPASKRVRM